MKKFLMLTLVLMASVVGFAQDAKPSQDNIIYIDVPAKMKIKDKIILVNKSPYTVLQSALVIAGEKASIGATTLMNPGETKVMASYDDNWLKNIRGKKLALKVKGLKKVLSDVRTTGIAAGVFGVGGFKTTEIKAEDLNNIDPELITYEFSASILEEDHDLYITITAGSSGNALDF